MSNTPVKNISPACVSARSSVLNAEGRSVPPADRAHLASCPRCNPLWTHIRRLTGSSRRLPLTPAPDALRARVLEQVQTRSTPTTFQPDAADGARKRFPYKPIVAGMIGVAAFASATGILVMNHAHEHTESTEAPAPVYSAVLKAAQATKTWHFKGWRTEDGKRVPWEIWGRRLPHFYREQIGDSFFLDNGFTQIQVLPPTPMRPRGLVLTTEAGKLPPLNGLSFENAGFLSGGNTGWSRMNRLDRYEQNLLLQRTSVIVREISDRTKRNPIIASSYGILDEGLPKNKVRFEETAFVQADARTNLPTHYSYTQVRLAPRAPRIKSVSVSVGKKAPEVKVGPNNTIEALALSYDVPLPSAVEKVEAPESYARVDLTKASGPQSDGTNRFTALGVTVEGKAVAQDAQGNLRLLFRPSLDGAALPKRDLRFGVSLSVPRRSLQRQKSEWGAVDDQGRQYLSISAPEYRMTSPSSPEMYLVPLEPLSPRAPRARRLQLVVQVNGNIWEWVRQDRAVKPAPGLQASGLMTIELPVTTMPLEYDVIPKGTPIYITAYSSNGVRRGRPFRETLAFRAAEARAQEYQTQASQTGVTTVPNNAAVGKFSIEHSPLEVHLLHQAMMWSEQAIRLAKQQSSAADSDFHVTIAEQRIKFLQTRLSQLNQQ